tara:strand:+ start:160 stop:360 length:201 start_codon:yes stop_codon:yes gene_type:complete
MLKKENRMIDFKQEIDEEVSEFEKSALESKDHLSPEIWENESLKPEIRDSLIKIANDFISALEKYK